MPLNLNEHRMLKHNFSFYFSSPPEVLSCPSVAPIDLSQMVNQVQAAKGSEPTQTVCLDSLQNEWG